MRLEHRRQTARGRPRVGEGERRLALKCKDDLGLLALLDRLHVAVASADACAGQRMYAPDDVGDGRLALVALVRDGGDGEGARLVCKERELAILLRDAPLLSVERRPAGRVNKIGRQRQARGCKRCSATYVRLHGDVPWRRKSSDWPTQTSSPFWTWTMLAVSATSTLNALASSTPSPIRS